jgi:2,3-bisphosphoglycerate-independent phosphoglycerate mutase
MSVLLIFIDGLGIGRREAANPFHELPEAAPFDGVCIRTDPRMGVEGRPQSASGQTTILTGVNIPQTLGYHKQGFPNAAMREILNEHSIFLQLEELGIEPNAFINAYTPQFFESEPRWKSATTVAVEAATMRFRTLEDLQNEAALFHDFTNQLLIERGFKIEEYSPERAGKILANLSAKNEFTLYEHFITDKLGHDQNMELARLHLPRLAKFVLSVLENIDLSRTTVLLTSDHGNIENLSVRNHTLNDVPTLAWGREKGYLASRIKSLADITPTIIEILKTTTEE